MLLALTNNGKRRAREVNSQSSDSSFLSVLLENGPSSIEEVAIDLHVPKSTVIKNARRLSKAGLIRREE